jgi:hypothetical protein
LRRPLKILVLVLCAAAPVLLYGAEILFASAIFVDSSAPLWSIASASAETQQDVAALAASTGAAFDIRNELEVLKELREHRRDAAPALMVGYFLDARNKRSPIATDASLVPLGGISNTLTLLCNESGRYVTYDSDQHGFRNPPGMWRATKADLAVVGESFTQGYCVPDGKGFVDLLRGAYPITLNLGMSGQSAVLQLAAIKEYLPRYAPRRLVWVYSEGIDVQDLYKHFDDPILKQYLQPDFTQHLVNRQSEIDSTVRQYLAAAETRERRDREHPRPKAFSAAALSTIKLWRVRTVLAATRADDQARSLGLLVDSHEYPMRQILQQAEALTRSWGGTMYFAYLPSWIRYRHQPRALDSEHATIVKMVRELGIPLIDVQPAFDAQGDPLSLFPFRRFGHYNENGNRIVADAIANGLRIAD